ncbi:hypothetical protein LAZ67_20002198 [Cordylochernes scorpioides]|uniref:Retrovirus-related Pol polyprotein from transposon TNT 1-94 n=1 Tax=Cordylochernes scorpioides TaxID=51811 RepID=A0ABY6LNI3_9ARAC|nr:hypothetical protein LAZ67_20002198 [Cordylochernes scorpioides]
MAAVSAITAAVEKLNGQNYRSWKYNIKMLLIEKGLWDVMFKDEDTQDAKLKAQKDRALAVIALSINTEHKIHIIDCSSPQDAWKNLEQVFEPKSRSRILQLKKQFVNIKLQTGESMLDYLNRLKICTDHLKEAGAEVDDQDIAYSMLSGLPDSFDTLVMSFGNVEDSDFTSNKVRNTLLTEYERRSAREGASSGLGEALNFSKDGTRKTSRKQGVKCYRCSKIGHIAKDCRSSINRDYKADKSYSRKKDSFKSPSENMLMAFNAVSSEDEFILDNGATHHVCKNRQWFTSFQPTTCEPIQTASGNLQIEGVGNIRMKMYLDTGTQDVTLNDVLFVPQARRNLLSVSQTEDKGKHIKICNHKARVFNENRVICVARNLNGLYIVRDDFSRRVTVYFLKHKDQVIEYFDIFRARAERETGHKIKRLRTDNGLEYCNKNFKQKLESLGIKHELTNSYSPQQNGVSERLNRSLLDMARASMHNADLPQKFWAESVNCAAYIQNRSLCSALDNKVPEEIWLSRKVSVRHFKIFGALAYAHIPKQKRKKFDRRAKRCILVGYSTQSKGYRLWDNDSKQVFITKHARFDENKVGLNQLKDDLTEGSEAKNSFVWLPQQGKVLPPRDPDLQQGYDSQLEVPSTSEVKDIVGGSSENTLSLRSRENERKTLNLANVELNLCEVSEPQTFEEAVCSPKSDLWKNAMQEELNCLEERQTWVITNLPKNKKVIGNRWVFKIKGDSKGKVSKFKARLVAKGYSQTPDIDFNQTYAPVANFGIIRMLLVLTQNAGWVNRHLDINNAYLYGELHEELYMALPPGVKFQDSKDKVLRLLKPIYGLKQAAFCWNTTLSKFLEKVGFSKIPSCNCIFVLDDRAIIAIYVDDLAIFVVDQNTLDEIEDKIIQEFQIKSLGPITFFLGVEINYGKESLSLNQRHYIQLYFKDIICSKFAKPDISFATSKLSQFCANPGKKHWEAAKHVLRYLSGTIDLELSYVKGNNNKVAMFTDADYGSDTDDRRSYSGMVAVIDGNVINWRSKKQQCVSLSTMESEYIALCHSAKEAVWLGQTLSDLGFISHFAKPLTIYCDNRSAIDFSKNNIENNRSKHISVQFHYTRDKINSGDIVVQFVNTKENLADIQTKTLKKLMHRDACFQMNLKSQQEFDFFFLRSKKDLELRRAQAAGCGLSSPFFRIVNLGGWMSRLLMEQQKLLELLEGLEIKPNVVSSDSNSESSLQNWKSKDVKARMLLSQAIELKFLQPLMNCTSASQMWQKLLAIHEQKSEFTIGLLWQQFFDARLTSETISDYIAKIENISAQISQMGGTITEDQKVAKILNTLPSSMRYFVAAWESLDPKAQTLNNLTARLLIEETRNQQSGSSKQDEALLHRQARTKPKDTQRSFQDAKKNTKCHYCHKIGHWSRECRKRLANEKNKSKNLHDSKGSSSDYGLILCDNQVEPSDIWYADSGASCSMTFRREWFKTYTPFTSDHPIYLGDNSTLLAEGMGDIEIQAYVDGGWYNTYIRNVLYSPQLKKNLYSLSTSTRRGFNVIIKHDKLQIFMDNDLKAVGVRHDDLYRMLFKVTSSSQGYITSENKLQFWHERLAHLPVATLREMATKGLVDGLQPQDLEGEFFFCEGCQLGKAHRKSCYPSDGKNYQLDYFSGYRHIYFIKNKSDVLDIFKEYATLIYTQTGNKIKVLRTDNALEFKSDNFADLCKRFGIIHEFTAPYVHEQIGRIERDNRTIVEAASCDSKHSSAGNAASIRYQFAYPMITRSKVSNSQCNFALADEPSNYIDAITSSDSERWKLAMDEEIDALNKNKTWTLERLADGHKPIGCKWVYKIKTESDGTIQRFKARLVAKGYSQIKNVDYFDTFSPVVRYDSLRILLSHAASERMFLKQFDVKTAFLNGELEELVYLEQPEGYKRDDNSCYRLHKSLYGLRQSSRNWNKKFTNFLYSHNFKTSDADPCIFIGTHNDSNVILALYVDDGIILSKDKEAIAIIMDELEHAFEITSGSVNFFVGLEIEQSEDRASIFIHQSSYIDKILSKFNMADCIPASVPMDPSVILTKQDCSTPEQKEKMPKFPFREAVGSLMFASCVSRPDITYAVSQVSKFLEYPGPAHCTTVKNIFRYLKGTPHMGILFTGQDQLVGYSDSDFARDVDSRKSTTGYAFMMNVGTVSWASQRQPIIALSTTESEYIAACSAAKELIWIRRLLQAIGCDITKETELYIDNQAAIKLVENPVFHKRTKHIDVRYHFIRSKHEEGELKVHHVCSSEQLADIMTKPLPRNQFHYLRGLLNILDREGVLE